MLDLKLQVDFLKKALLLLYDDLDLIYPQFSALVCVFVEIYLWKVQGL